jgi:EPS-associated MarR family transcriptional regulator
MNEKGRLKRAALFFVKNSGRLSLSFENNILICLYVHTMNNNDDQEIRYRLFKLLGDDPSLTQRQMAEKMGISLGKFNYCLNELVKKGFVKINRFKSSQNKAAYMYILTPHGLEEKTKITVNFLKRKIQEFDEIKKQIQEIAHEAESEELKNILGDNNFSD